MENKSSNLVQNPPFCKADVMRSFFQKPSKVIKVEIPKGFFNCGVSICNHFIADTNNVEALAK